MEQRGTGCGHAALKARCQCRTHQLTMEPSERKDKVQGAETLMKAVLVAWMLAAPFSPVLAKTLPTVAVFGFALTNTSPAPSTPEELARLQRLDQQLKSGLRDHFQVVDVGPVQNRLAGVDSIRGCNGCELDLARQLGAEQVAYGWVQKVSNLILNVNLVVEEASTGRTLRAESVDIRGNTDESWSRGLRYLLNERMFRGE